ncbi:hypothetical protein PENSPDRAFT_607419 [Peniophora sp. CONT]|nr:hypothetical protein PENSPDRAFT_607419 [Peniophora sp. CONT]
MLLNSPADVADVAFGQATDVVFTNKVGLASFCVLIWDHAATFDEEIFLIWRCIPQINRKEYRKIAFVALFMFNRYIVPLSFIVNLVAYFSTSWTVEVRAFSSRSHCTDCDQFVVYEGIMTMVGVAVADLIMLNRVEALWSGTKYCRHAVGGLLSIWMIFVVVNSWLLVHAGAVYHPPIQSSIHPDAGLLAPSCTMVFDSQYGYIAPASAWLPLLYDTVVIILTVIRTWPSRRASIDTVARELLREGILYYGVVFGVTFALTFMIAFARVGIQNICAQLELCLTAAMVSRITLGLKRRFSKLDDTPYQATPISTLDWHAVTRPPRVMLGNGRVHFVEHAQEDMSVSAVTSLDANEEGEATAAAIGIERDPGIIEITVADVGNRKKESSESQV